ncbi:uncharacterized protein [Physcomitrium patens]|uniref:Uncharacterized protein n=1 Tax=Physcomitrium patens TaxID=3218 RepID=A0A2K1JWB9_PHYPA|nr:endoplasmic reticulum metallopeptidase 1-like [Physcomitrium patens]XP_024388358.1 endoplasmic reticulum metallopeptidase 1-like [Physcomitrium patens]XP_024388360.1 endoplasmic reticulum metallopeptidase 1-like [Physcomitrium patens]XP_024388361.1 endoplasmic reticulum metallopeptidase 1-like [Physcomitrium patens]PNR45814.1 hypothetical protein PHYPA_015585 [Physcomitrium patens]|eukprot:XP_024388357.1 endoplasmic reticulum metallopeptidase 1-like [Physcomitrella patens]
MLRRKNSKLVSESNRETLNQDLLRTDEEDEKKKYAVAKTSRNAVALSLGGLFVLFIFFTPLIWQARQFMYQKHVVPLPESAPLNKFSQERAMNHIRALAVDIVGRQEATSGLAKSFSYVISFLNDMKDRANSDLIIEIDDALVDGSFNLNFLGHSVSNFYKNHRNLAVRISSKDAQEGDATVLVNGHLDGPLGSPGAADCASCVASMMEVMRYIVDTNWIPPAPLVFLFNGAEEVFLLGAHGFITAHRWKDSIGAVINIEASGASGPDLVVQSGPGTWPARVYGENAVHPMANTVAQDVMPLIPGDTDYRVFTKDFGDIPGLDIIFVLEGYVYHTGYDTADRISRESLQARGENLIALLQGFTTAPELKNASVRAAHPDLVEKRPIFFDFYGMFMISYSQTVALALHALPLFYVLFFQGMRSTSEGAPATVATRMKAILRGVSLQFVGSLLSFILPVVLAILRLTVSKSAMTWFAHPWISYLMFVPVCIAGFLIPRVGLYGDNHKPLTEQKEKELDWSAHWGGIALNAALAIFYRSLGISIGYMNFFWAFFMIPALSTMRFCQRWFGKDSLLAAAGYILPGLLPAGYMCYYSGITIQLMTEKMGMSGTFPPAISFYVSDVILAVVFGIFAGATVGPLLPVLARWIGRPPVLRFLFYVSICSAALSSLLFPYSFHAPKRVILTHAYQTNGSTEVLASGYTFATIDPNPMDFVWKHSPEAIRMLHIHPQDASLSKPNPNVFLALYPICTLLTLSPEIPTLHTTVRVATPLPYLRVVQQNLEEGDAQTNNPARRRVHLEVHMGALEQVWSTVMNITGRLASWSLADQELPSPESVDQNGVPSYFLRLSGKPAGGVWQLWVETEAFEKLSIDLAVLDQVVDDTTAHLSRSFPPWVALVAGSTYISSYSVLVGS